MLLDTRAHTHTHTHARTHARAHADVLASTYIFKNREFPRIENNEAGLESTYSMVLYSDGIQTKHAESNFLDPSGSHATLG